MISALLVSTGGAVAKSLMRNSDVRFDYIITDRTCGAYELAQEFDIPLIRIDEPKNSDFGVELARVINEKKIDCVFVFFTRILSAELLDATECKFVNFHPSLLPACPGLNGFNDTFESGSILVGSTVHFIDKGVDTGLQIIQFFHPRTNESKSELRHIVFCQQVASLHEIHDLLKEELVHVVDGRVKVDGKTYPSSENAFPELSEESKIVYGKLINV
ncbi:formyltransferase family protein [Vibrio cyclitrophicus]